MGRDFFTRIAYTLHRYTDRTQSDRLIGQKGATANYSWPGLGRCGYNVPFSHSGSTRLLREILEHTRHRVTTDQLHRPRQSSATKARLRVPTTTVTRVKHL